MLYRDKRLARLQDTAIVIALIEYPSSAGGVVHGGRKKQFGNSRRSALAGVANGKLPMLSIVYDYFSGS
jgi:hypothetical protein